MKTPKIIFTYLILLFTLQICFAQEKPKAELIDKFSNDDGSDQLQARIFTLINAVNNSKSKGYIIIYGSKKDSVSKYVYERRIRNCFFWADVPQTDFIFVLGEDRDEFEIELWNVPRGADKPQYMETPKDFVVQNLSEQQLIWEAEWIEEYCPLGFNLEFYSKFLKASPNLIGKVIIRQRNLRNFNRVKEKILRELTKTNKVSQKQLEFVKGEFENYQDIEYWFIIKKQVVP